MSRPGDEPRAGGGGGDSAGRAVGGSAQGGSPPAVHRRETLPARHRLRAGCLAAVGIALLLAPSDAWSQSAVRGTLGVPVITPPVERALERLQEGWLRWTGALYSGDPERALEAVEDLLANAERLGMERLPDLAAGALLQAVEAAREGEGDQAELALEAAARLDPGRPETAFARAEVARLSGDPVGRLLSQVVGYARTASVGELRTAVLLDLVLWLLLGLLVAGGLFLALLMVADGRALVEDLGRWLAERLPRPLVQPAVVVLLAWPLAVPWGPVWLVLYWSLLLWRRAEPSERAVIASLWLLLGAAPWVVDRTQKVLAVELSPPVRAMESIEAGRLYGGLFADLGSLPALLPDSPAVDQLLGDLHARLGQWELAHRRYQAVLAVEPRNVPALIGVGAYHFDRGDYGNAIASFREAAAIDPQSAAAHFDLSLAYTESNLFAENRQALLEARRANNLLVSEWMDRPEGGRFVTVEGGVARIGEIEAALVDTWRSAETLSPGLELVRAARSLLALVGIGGIGLALLAVARMSGDPADTSRRPVPGSGPRDRRDAGTVAQALVPGLRAAWAGRGFAAFAAVLPPALLLVTLAVAVGPDFGFPVPWRYDPGDWLLLWLSLAGIAALIGVSATRAYHRWKRGTG